MKRAPSRGIMSSFVSVRQLFRHGGGRLAALTVALLLLLHAFGQPHAQMASAPSTSPALGTGVLPSDQVEKLLPPSVYFKGQSAQLQLRNAAGLRSASGSIAWMALVDTSGYSTGVRERYQFYLVTEAPLQFGDAVLSAGAYGAGFLADGKAIILDLGAHEIAHTSSATDASLRRPRPLQLTGDGPAYRLYLGKQYVSIAFRP